MPNQKCFTHALQLLWIGLGLTTVSACDSESGQCTVVEEMTLADDEQSPDGVTALDVLAMAAEQDVTLEWDVAPTGESPTNADPSLSTIATIVVERASGDVRHVLTEQSGSSEQDRNCGSSLYVPVRANVVTSDGALADDFEGELVLGAEKPGVPTLTVEFDFDDLDGTLRPTVDGATGEIYAEFGASYRGWIGVVDVSEGGSGVRESWEMGGHWGDVPPTGE